MLKIGLYTVFLIFFDFLLLFIFIYHTLDFLIFYYPYY